MGIADLFRPKYRHSNLRVRTEAVRALTSEDAAVLIQIARTDRDAGVRRLAIERIAEPDTLAAIAAEESERSLRAYAGERAVELWRGTACDHDLEAATAALTGIVNLDDQRALAAIAAHAALPAIRKRAFGELRDARALAELAKGDAAPDLRLAAVSRIDDGEVLRALAIDTTQKEVGLAAVDKLEDPAQLEHVANKAKNKAVRQRARKTLVEMAEAERASRAVLPDEVKRRRAERSQLIRELETLADTFEFERYAPTVTRAMEAWRSLDDSGDEAGGDADARFAKSVERFWNRKELHEQQLRAAEEARAAARAAQKPQVVEDPAPREAPAVAAPKVDDPPRPGDAGAAATREQARLEREARKQEEAQRAAAIAASLAATCDDLETLAGKDMRTIERALQQAAKVFEQIGKVPGEARDAIAERYSKVRGVLIARVGELREAEDWARFQNVPKAEALVATAKQMAAEQPSPDLGNRLRALQALWKEVGPMPQRRSKELWEQFKQTCDQIYETVKGYRAVENEKFVEIAKAKEALIASAEALAESTDWAITADKLKALQAQWKDSGHLPRKQGDELWKRFRAACNVFFDRRKPLIEARRAEENDNLAAKRALVTRAQKIADDAPGDAGWGRAIGQIKDLQREWKDVGAVPRRDAESVYREFRAACDALFAKRDAALDAEANSHRAEVEAVQAEIVAIASAIANPGSSGDGSGASAAQSATDSPSPNRDGSGSSAGIVERAIAVRARVRELDRRELSSSIDAMSRTVIVAHPDAVRGTELDPIALRSRRDKLIGKVEELLPKPPTASAADGAGDLGAQLMAAMRSNAFGDLRFSGRDPVEVIDDLRAQWTFAGPLLDADDHGQAERFEIACQRVRAAFHRPEGSRGDDDRDDQGRSRRRRRSRNSNGVVGTAEAGTDDSTAAPQLAHDAPTARAHGAIAPMQPPAVPGADAPAVTRTKTSSIPLPMDPLDEAWDLPTDDPTALAAGTPNVPSSSEMAGDGAAAGDGLDEPGWD